MRALIQNHQVDGEVLRAPILVSAQQFVYDFEIRGFIDADQNDRQITRDPLRPERSRCAAAARDLARRRPQARVCIEHMTRQPLEEIRLVRVDREVAKLHLRLGPGERRHTLEHGGIVVFVDAVERLRAR